MKKYVNTMLERIVGGDSTAGLDRKLIEEGEIISQDDLDNLVGLCAHLCMLSHECQIGTHFYC